MRVYKIDKDFNYELIGDESDFKYLMSLDNWYTSSMMSINLYEIEKYGHTTSRGFFYININHNFITNGWERFLAIKNKIVSEIRNKKIEQILQ